MVKKVYQSNSRLTSDKKYVDVREYLERVRSTADDLKKNGDEDSLRGAAIGYLNVQLGYSMHNDKSASESARKNADYVIKKLAKSEGISEQEVRDGLIERMFEGLPEKSYDLTKKLTSKDIHMIREGKIPRHILVIIGVVGLLGATLFLLGNSTGNVVNSSSSTASNWIGVSLFIISLSGLFAYFRKTK